MQRPTCTKCGSSFVRLDETLDGYYSHCKCCGLLTLLQSKYEDVLANDINLAEADVDENPAKVHKAKKYYFSRPTLSYYAVKALQGGNKTSTEIVAFIVPRLKTATLKSIQGNIGATLSALCKEHQAVELVSHRNGVKGGSLWTLGSGAEDYLRYYTIHEEKERVEASIKAEGRKPTLMEMLAGKKITNPSQRLSALYG